MVLCWWSVGVNSITVVRVFGDWVEVLRYSGSQYIIRVILHAHILEFGNVLLAKVVLATGFLEVTEEDVSNIRVVTIFV